MNVAWLEAGIDLGVKFLLLIGPNPRAFAKLEELKGTKCAGRVFRKWIFENEVDNRYFFLRDETRFTYTADEIAYLLNRGYCYSEENGEHYLVPPSSTVVSSRNPSKSKKKKKY